MRKSKAKQSIVKTAQKLIEKKGYSDLNVNEVAYVAKVSIGTLYYHFPKGKVDILAEINSQRIEEFAAEFNRQLEVEGIINKGMNLNEMLHWIFKRLVELRKADRHLISAIQSELLSNPDDITEFVKTFQGTDGIQQGMSILSGMMTKVAGAKKSDGSKLKEKQTQIQKVVGLLMSYQIIFPGYFGDDDDFVKLAVQLFLEILSE